MVSYSQGETFHPLTNSANWGRQAFWSYSGRWIFSPLSFFIESIGLWEPQLLKRSWIQHHTFLKGLFFFSPAFCLLSFTSLSYWNVLTNASGANTEVSTSVQLWLLVHSLFRATDIFFLLENLTELSKDVSMYSTFLDFSRFSRLPYCKVKEIRLCFKGQI